MDMDLSSQLIAAQSSKTQFLALVNMVDQVARSAPPPGQGTKVDKIA